MAKGTTIYLVNHDDAMEHSRAFATLAEAREFRAGLKHPDGEIEKITVADMPIRQMLAAVYNREGFSGESEVVVAAHEMPRVETVNE